MIPRSPWGTVTDTTPTYKWTKVSGATNYQFKLLKDSALVYSKTVSSSVCGSTTCSSTPSTALDSGSYEWQVRAKVSGAWKSYSSSNYFSIDKGFDSEFTSNAAGWTTTNGSWSVSSGYYRSSGLADMTASAYHDNGLSHFTYEVRMRRAGCAYCQNSIYFYGNPGSISREGDWDNGYRFAYTNDGMFSIVKYQSTLNYVILGWTPFSGLTSSWNTLKVTLHGSYAQFFINGAEVAHGNLPSFDSGYAGVAFFRDASSTGNRLYVDWARLTMLPATSSVISGEGIDISDLGAGPKLLIDDFNVSP